VIDRYMVASSLSSVQRCLQDGRFIFSIMQEAAKVW
jgi:hypothetical protein